MSFPKTYLVKGLLLLSLFLSITAVHAQSDFNLQVEPDPQIVYLNEESNISSGIRFELQGLESTEITVSGEKFERYSISGEVKSGPIGWYQLPTVVRYFLVPPQSGIDLKITNIETELREDVNPYPVQPGDTEEFAEESVIDLEGYLPGNIYKSRECLEFEGFFPPERIALGNPAILRGYRIVPVIINPLRFNSATRELEIIKSIDFELDFETDLNRINIVKDPDRARPSRAARRIISDLVLNPPPQRDVPPTGGSIMYIIGNWNDIEEELQPLVEWRRRMGWTVEVVRVAQGNAGAIKNAILEAYEEWDVPPEHVVICGDTDGPFTRAYWDMRRGAGFPYETDHQYVELEGDDVLPEASLGRLIFQSVNMLRGIVDKTVLYESDPYIGDDDERGWQKRAAFVASDNRSGTSSIDLCRWTKDIALRKGYNEVDELYWTPNLPQAPAQNFIISHINEGVSLFIYRGFTFMSGFHFDDVDNLRNRRMLPFAMLSTCNTGDYGEHISSFYYYSERFNYAPNGGAIGAVGAAGATHTAYNNLITASTFKAFLLDGIYTQGWALMKGKVDLYRHYADRGDINHRENPGLQAWLCELYIFNLMGDPAVDLFTDIPQELVVERPETIRRGESSFNVVVNGADDEEPVEDALVCVYKADEFQLVARTDANGRADFHLDPEFMQDGIIMLTVTGHNLKSELVDYEIETPQAFLAVGGFDLDDDNEGESSGDGDGTANPLERLEISVNLANFGTDTLVGEIIVNLSASHPQLEVIVSSDTLESAPLPDESTPVPFVVEIGGGFPNGEDAVFTMEVSAGEDNWTSLVSIPVEGPEIEFEVLEWVEETLQPGEIAEVNLTIKNVGERAAPELTGTVIPVSRTVGAPGAEGTFESIEPGESASSGEPFRLSAHPLHIVGRPVEFLIALESETGFLDTAYFSFVVEDLREGQPFGPDDYGYICFDDTDENWFLAPVFEWIEIDTSEDGPGTDTELSDIGEEHDASTLVNLPFIFIYYGQEFDQITVCTNGWLAMGDHAEINTARNRRIPAGMVGSSMICPLWDDLITTRDGGIFTWYDVENHIFVIEWSKMRKLGPRGGNEPIETFEVILYDPEFHPSFTGDGDIKFQYLDVTDSESAFQEWDTPFATVGIGDPDQQTGLEYTYWGELHRSAAPLENERAIKFTTLIDFMTGTIAGKVIDVVTRAPIQDVVITTTYGFSATTNDSGYYIIPDILVDTTITYEVTAEKEFYNDSTITDLNLIPDDTLLVNFELLHPEFGMEFGGVNVEIENYNGNDFYIPLVNSGSGPLTYTSRLEFEDVGINRDNAWDPLLELNVSEAFAGMSEEGDSVFIGNKHVLGVVFIDDLFYIAAGGSDREGQYCEVYRFSRRGEFVDSLAQPWIDNWGIRGMTYDGYNIWAAFDRHLFKMNLEFAVLDSFEVPLWQPRDVAFDPATNTLYTSGLTDDIFALDTLGNIIDSWDPVFEGVSIRNYGLSWYPSQPDTMNLLIHSTINDMPAMYAFDIRNGETKFLTSLVIDEEDSPAGMDITRRWNSSIWTVCTIVSHRDGDRLTVFELEPFTNWLIYSPSSGRLDAGQDTTLHIRVESTDLFMDRYWLILSFEHNANPGFFEIPIVMNVVKDAGLAKEEAIPAEFSLEQNFPNPFNPATSLSYSIPQRGHVRLDVYDINGRLIKNLVDEIQENGHYSLTFEAASLPNGVYLYRLETDGDVASKKMVLMK